MKINWTKLSFDGGKCEFTISAEAVTVADMDVLMNILEISKNAMKEWEEGPQLSGSTMEEK